MEASQNTIPVDRHGVFVGPSSTRTLAALQFALLLIDTERIRTPHMADPRSRYVTTAGELTLAEIAQEIHEIIDGCEGSG